MNVVDYATDLISYAESQSYKDITLDNNLIMFRYSREEKIMTMWVLQFRMYAIQVSFRYAGLNLNRKSCKNLIS
jgi:hypothetical protein